VAWLLGSLLTDSGRPLDRDDLRLRDDYRLLLLRLFIFLIDHLLVFTLRLWLLDLHRHDDCGFLQETAQLEDDCEERVNLRVGRNLPCEAHEDLVVFRCVLVTIPGAEVDRDGIICRLKRRAVVNLNLHVRLVQDLDVEEVAILFCVEAAIRHEEDVVARLAILEQVVRDLYFQIVAPRRMQLDLARARPAIPN